MNTCKTCRRWRRIPDQATGLCNLSGILGDMHTEEFYGENGSSVFTGPDFGCIHHEPDDDFSANVANLLKLARDDGITELRVPQRAEIKNYSATLDSTAAAAQDTGGDSVQR